MAHWPTRFIECGVPVVLASQIALTTQGSDELIKSFLAGVVAGDDPRLALRTCRDRLRDSKDETYYDRVALVGYVHLDEDFEKHLPTRRFQIALARLKAISKHATNRIDRILHSGDGITPEARDQMNSIVRQFVFVLVREGLETLENDLSRPLTTKEQEKLYGLVASSLKREAEPPGSWAAVSLVKTSIG